MLLRHLFRCALASLYEIVSVPRSVGWSVACSVGWSEGNQGSPTLTLLNVLGELGVLNVLNVLNMLLAHVDILFGIISYC